MGVLDEGAGKGQPLLQHGANCCPCGRVKPWNHPSPAPAPWPPAPGPAPDAPGFRTGRLPTTAGDSPLPWSKPPGAAQPATAAVVSTPCPASTLVMVGRGAVLVGAALVWRGDGGGSPGEPMKAGHGKGSGGLLWSRAVVVLTHAPLSPLRTGGRTVASGNDPLGKRKRRVPAVHPPGPPPRVPPGPVGHGAPPTTAGHRFCCWRRGPMPAPG